MSRVFFVTDARGERQFDESRLPITLGGQSADIVLPGIPDQVVVAHIALANGHAFIQPESADAQLFHNHERLQASAWLKSGDQVQLHQALLRWGVTGDQVRIVVSEGVSDDIGKVSLTPPADPPVRDMPLPVEEYRPAVRSHRRLKQVAAGMLALLVMLALFVLLATPVDIQIRPEPENYTIKGFPPMFSLGGRQLALPGNYRITAEREGYFRLDESLKVNRGGLQLLQWDMRERPGQVMLTVTPAVQFNLFVDDERVDVDARSIVEIDRGEHQLRVQTDWYLPVEKAIEVIGLGRSQQLELALTPAWAEAKINSLPEGAQVHNNSELLGVTPLQIRLLQGVQTLILEKELFKSTTIEVNVIAGEALLLDDIALIPADGQLKLDSVPEASTLQVDGHYQGTTPTMVMLSSGVKHRLQLSKPGYTNWQQTITLEPEQQRVLTATLKPEYGTVFINAEPADAKLRIDGKAQGNASRRLRLTSRPHRLEVYREGYETYTLTVTPDAANSSTVNVVLKTAVQARIEATPATIRSPTGQLLRLVRPDGSFKMGASRREAGRRANESPRLIVLKRPFYFSEKEVTNGEYRQFGQQHRTGRADGASLDGDQQPVAGISRDDAARYSNWLSRKHGLPEAYRKQAGRMQLVRPVNTGYRLPSEAEWAYVARKLGRTGESRYPWPGSYPPTLVAGNFADVRISDTLAETVPGYDDQYRGSAPVGSFPAFPDGFYDLGGNVAEWMNDYYTVYPGKASQQVQDPFGPDTGKHFVVRGSSWRHGNITELRLSYRDYSRKPRADVGFRLVRYAD